MVDPKVVYEPMPRYHVEVGDPSYVNTYRPGGFAEKELTYVEWEFDKAFASLSDAEGFAKREAETTEYVRVVDTRPEEEAC